MDTLRNLNRLHVGIDKQWILQDHKKPQHLLYDYLQQINFRIQDLNAEYSNISNCTVQEQEKTLVNDAKVLYSTAMQTYHIPGLSQHSTTAWGAVPIQDYYEPWWHLSIDEIDEN